jgi:RNA polymerase sigma-54 factor
MEIVQDTRLDQLALPALLRTLALLPLSAPELDAEVERATAANPALERRGAPPCPGCGFPGAAGGCGRCGGGPVRAAEPAEDPFDGIELAAACEIDPAARGALPFVLDHLTPRGLLDTDPDDIAIMHRLAPAHVREAVRAVVAAGPPGVASRTVGDLLAAQAAALAPEGAPRWLVPLLREHLPWVAARDVAAVAECYGTTPPEAEHAFAWIRARLRPAAGVRRARRPAVLPAPDVFVDRGPGGDLVVRVPGSGDLGLVVLPVAAPLRDHPEAAAWLERHRQAGRELLRQIDVRAGTLTRVAGEIVRRQRRYFDAGPAGQVDLTRAEIAAAVGVHPSTVSRAAAGKSLRRPDGAVVDLALLFGIGTAARERLRELLDGADGRRPSDARVAELLAADGFPVARRTVAKYRARLEGAPRS